MEVRVIKRAIDCPKLFIVAMLLVGWWMHLGAPACFGVFGFGEPVPLNTNFQSDTDEDVFPVVATDGLGHWVVVWYATEPPLWRDKSVASAEESDWDIFVSRSADNGATWSDPATLNTNADSDSGRDYQPYVTTDGSGNWIAVWSSNENLGGVVGTDGDMHIGGSLSQHPTALGTPGSSDPFIYKNDSSSVVVYIDASGNLKLEGYAFIGEDPDPD